MTGMDPNRILDQAKQRGIPDATFKTLRAAGLDLDSWLSGFDNVVTSVQHSVDTIKNHPLLNFAETSVKATQAITPLTTKSALASAPPTVAKTRIPKITVTGFVICPTTGKLDLVTPTDERTRALIEEHHRAELEVQNSAKETAAGNRDAFSA
jgi:carbonic anhydrase